ncbi:MAG: DUF2461 domain-containing protein [Bacteroidetes bacterium]|nr:DUF2461 domain-containing protein [Bacteroidota bacterium]
MQKVFTFLKALKSNNNKEWFDKNKEKYLEAKQEFEILVDKLIAGIAKFDKKISADMKGKDCTFRIYKDVRFSKDKTPYKANMGASINPGGKKSLEAGYYFHCEPNACFLAGGVYMPEPTMLQAIRQEIDYNFAPLDKIFKSASFKKYFNGLSDEGKLKTAPKGFEKDHPQIELLKNKHFIVSHNLSDKQILAKDIDKKIVSGFKAMYPFLEYLREATAQ